MSYGKSWGKVMGESVEFEEQIRLGEIVLDDDRTPDPPSPTLAWGLADAGSPNKAAKSSSSSSSSSSFIPERGIRLKRSGIEIRKPPQGRGRGAPLSVPREDDDDDFIGLGCPRPVVPSGVVRVSDQREPSISSYSRFHGSNRCGGTGDSDNIAVTLSESPKREIVTTLGSPNVSPNSGLFKESHSYAPHGRGTVRNRSGIDSPGVKYIQQNTQNLESSPIAIKEIQTACLKKSRIVLNKLSQEKEPIEDSDDKESLENIPDIKSTCMELEHLKEDPCSPKKQDAENGNINEIDDEGELTVEYGCIQLSDVPGRILVRGGEKHRALRKIDLLDNYDILKRGINNCGIQDLNMLQKAVSPYVFSGSDCFIFGGKSCGKSLSYLIPMIASFITDFEIQGYTSRKNEFGPIALIICKDFRSGLKIEGHINNLVTSANKYQIYGALVCDDRRETREKLEVGVDVMITTLDFATRLAKKKYNSLPLKSVRMLVFEEIDILLRLSPYDFQLIHESAENFAAKLKSDKPFQRIFCGKDWTPEVEDLYLSLFPLPDPTVGNVPVILIQSPNQAVKYSNLKLYFHHIPIGDDGPDGPSSVVAKMYKLKELLESKELEHHLDIFIACSMPTVVQMVHDILKSLGIDTRSAETNTMDHHQLGTIKRRWQDSPTKRRILVLHDKVLRSLEVHNVTLLIHFDLPKKTPEVVTATGADRFSCMWGNFRDLSKEKRKPSLVSERKDLESHFLLTGTEPELYKLKVFGSKLGCAMPESLEKLAEEMGKAHMDGKKVCPYVKLYGECSVLASEGCPFRHYFLADELQKEPVVPRSCELELRITKCINPSQYIGQIIRLHEIEKGKRKPAVSYANLLKKRTRELTKYYEIEENRIPLECYAPGTLCAVELPEGEGYARAVIDRVMTRTSLNLPNTIRVYCLDIGEHLQPLAEDLLVLREDMKEMKNLSVEINLANLQPPKGEVDYRPHHINGARNLTTDRILIGRVRFAIGSEVWINPLIEMEIDSNSKCASKKLSVRLELMRCYFADNNEDHMSKIFKLCQDTGFLCPELEDDYESEAKFPTFFQLGDEINWAFLNVNDKELAITTFWPTYTRDPYNIYGVQDKFSTQLDELEYDVHDFGQQMVTELCPQYAEKFASMYAPDMMVAAFDTMDKVWRRALIVAAYEKEGQSTFDVYFTDLGQLSTDFTSKDLLPIPSSYVNRLPCQAIALKLSHIRPIQADKTNFRWSSEVIDKLMTYTVDEQEDAIQMDVIARKSIVHQHSPCRYYEAVILQPNGDDIGESLVAGNLAEFVEGEEETAKSIRSRLLVKINQSFNALLEEEESSEEDESNNNEVNDDGSFFEDDEDRWDVAGFNFNEIREIFGKNGIKKPRAIFNPSSESDENEAEISPALVEAGNSADVKSPAIEQSEQPTNSSVIAKPSLFSDLLHPTVFWKQTRHELILNIQLPDIKEYDLNIVQKKVSFRTLKPAGYGFDLEFHARLRPPEVEIFGLYMRLKFKKRIEWLWPKLLNEPMKLPWLKQDYEADDSDDEREKEWVEEELAKKKQKKNDGDEDETKKKVLLPFEVSSDSESEEDVDDAEFGTAGEELTEEQITEMMEKLKLDSDTVDE